MASSVTSPIIPLELWSHTLSYIYVYSLGKRCSTRFPLVCRAFKHVWDVAELDKCVSLFMLENVADADPDTVVDILEAKARALVFNFGMSNSPKFWQVSLAQRVALLYQMCYGASIWRENNKASRCYELACQILDEIAQASDSSPAKFQRRAGIVMTIFSYVGKYYVPHNNAEPLEDRTQRLFGEKFPDSTIVPVEAHLTNFLLLAADGSSANTLEVSLDDIEAAKITTLQRLCSATYYVNPNSSENVIIPLSEIKSGRTLDHLRDYFDIVHSRGPMNQIKRPLRSNDLTQVVQPVEYATWAIQLSYEDTSDLLMVANLLGMNPLLELTSASVAALIKGKAPEEIRRIFNITTDRTPDEAEQIRQENQWAEEA